MPRAVREAKVYGTKDKGEVTEAQALMRKPAGSPPFHP